MTDELLKHDRVVVAAMRTVAGGLACYLAYRLVVMLFVVGQGVAKLKSAWLLWDCPILGLLVIGAPAALALGIVAMSLVVLRHPYCRRLLMLFWFGVFVALVVAGSNCVSIPLQELQVNPLAPLVQSVCASQGSDTLDVWFVLACWLVGWALLNTRLSRRCFELLVRGKVL